MTSRRRWYNVGVVKIPHGDRDIARKALGDRPDDTRFQDIRGADTPDDDDQFPIGSRCAYRAALTDKQAEQFRAAENCRYVSEDVTVTGVLAGAATIPGWRVRDTMGYWPNAEGLMPGLTTRAAILDTGTSSAQRDYMGHNLVARAVFAPFAPPTNENYPGSNHGSLCASLCVPLDGQLIDEVVIAFDDTTGSDSGTDSGVALGVNHAVANGAKVISGSIGFGSTPMPATLDALEAAAGSDVVFYFAQGNDASLFSPYPARYSFEAGVSYLYTVGGWDMARRWRWSSANWHAQMTGIAPSTMVRAVTASGGEGEMEGTSAATPVVADMCVRLIRSGITARQAAAALEATTVDMGMGVEQGGGMFNLRAAATYLGIMPPVAASVDRRRQRASSAAW